MSIHSELASTYQDSIATITTNRKKHWGGLLAIVAVTLLMWGANGPADAIKALAIVMTVIAFLFYRVLCEINERLDVANQMLLGISDQSTAPSSREVAARMADD